MRTATLQQAGTAIKGTALLVLLSLLLPYMSAAELQPMTETELKSMALNDYLRPVDIMIIETEDMGSYGKDDVSTLTVTRAETPIIIDAERLIDDLMTQYEHMENGKGAIEGFLPIINDPSYLIKQ